ncbi:MAG: ABC transporter substrate-binding protein [Lachnospiraceae bacterium]|jgi:putative aldouronate transport system substrate-binding protein|nr:ABC transporter substrate-binding protein [Lachnospiraceae bacterium]MCX4315880.1 ABC transporter substrate-binding protein [Lachnospiraceae bacterium]
MKKWISLLLVVSLLGCLLAGCQKKEGNQGGGKTEDNKTSGETSGGGSDDTSKDSTSGEKGDASSQEPYVLKLMYPGTAKSEDCDEVAALANEILQPKFNTTLEIVRVGFGTYPQEVNLMLSSGEKLDLIYNNRDIFASAVSNGQIVEIGQYFDEYAPEMKAAISEEDWACTTVDGGIYAVPANKEKAVAWGFSFSKKIADELGYDYSTIKTEDDLEPFLTAVRDKYPDMYPVVSNGGSMTTMVTTDDLGYDFGVLKDCTNPDDTTVVNWYATEEYKKIVERRYDWAQKGLIMPDAAASTEDVGTLISSGKGFGRFCNVKPGIEEEQERSTSVETVALWLTDTYTTTTRLDILWYVVHNSEKPERVVQVMNEIYTNPELQNILVNGVEGKHYEYTNAEKTMIQYPEGVDGTNTGYPSYPWAWLNEMITPVWAGNNLTLWEETEEYNQTAIVSPGKGFSWNNASVVNEVTACNNVRNKYANALECGSVDPAVALPQFIKELEEAGVNRIIEEKQKQLDEWLASK